MLPEPVNEVLEPLQIEPEPAVAAGPELTVAEVDPVAVQLVPVTEIVKLYVPVMPVVALVNVGFARVEVKPEGPFHKYVAGVAGPEIFERRFNVLPAQTGPLFEGAAFNVPTVTKAVATAPPETV